MDFFKYFKYLQQGREQDKADAPQQAPNDVAANNDVVHPSLSGTFLADQIERSANMLAAYREANTVAGVAEQKAVLEEHLQAIKQAVEQPKEADLDPRFATIKENLGAAECGQTIRDERWQGTVYCPYCSATNIERLPPTAQLSAYNFRYICLECRSRFNDDSRTPFEAKIPTLDTWMQCWFLLGCTESIDYIAAKLNLEPEQVKSMATELRRVFNANQPLTHLMSYELWHQAHAEKISSRIHSEIILKKQELFRGNAVTQPKDTAELRRQKERNQAPGSAKLNNSTNKLQPKR